MQRPLGVADAWRMPPVPTPFERLDPKLDIVFKLLLVRTQVLLVDMLEAVLGRPVSSITVLNPDILGELASDKRVVLDIRVSLSDGSRIDVEMQARTTPALRSRLVYYATRDHSDQLSPGDGYEELTPTVVIAWLVEPIPELPHRLHTVYGLRAEHTNERFSDQLAIHVLQLSALPAASTMEYATNPRVELWARFLAAHTDADYDQLASEDPIMAIAKQALDELSQDPVAHRMSRERADAVKLYQMDLVAWGAKARAEALAEGRAGLLLKQLTRRFGPLTDATRARVQSASIEQLETWAERILDALALDEVLAS
jgi:predicted transposase/invertase (TIGR01784 family)